MPGERLMGRRFEWPAVLAGLVLMGGTGVARPVLRAEEPAKRFEEQFGPFLTSHCVSCHSGDKPKGKLSLENPKPDLTDAVVRKQWAAVVKRLWRGRCRRRGSRDRPTRKSRP